MATTTDTAKVERVVYDSLVSFGAERDDIRPQATFGDLDVDSLDLAELSQIVEDEFGVAFKSSDVEQLKTVGDAIDFIVRNA